MTRVLHVTLAYFAGVGRAIDTIVRETPQHEHHLLHAAPVEIDVADGYTTAEELPRGPLARLDAVRSAVRRLDPDVVHAHSSWAGVLTRLRPLGAPVVYQPHCYKFDDPATGALARSTYRLVEKALHGRADRVVVLSEHEERLARSLGEQVVTEVVTNASTLDAARSASPESRDPSAGVVMVGRISPQKDPEHFAHVASLVSRERPGTAFTWIGDGDAEARQRLESAGVRVTGWLDGDELARELDRAGVYYHSARYEGFPLSVLDAAARRVPVIARRIPAFDGIPLTLVDDPAAAARAIGAALDDPTERHAIASLTQRLHQTMSADAHAAAVSKLYERYTAERVIP